MSGTVPCPDCRDGDVLRKPSGACPTCGGQEERRFEAEKPK